MPAKIISVFVFAFVLMNAIHAQQAPQTAEQILNEAYKQAAKEKKNVFVMFHASWCGWCHKMDDSMNDESVKKYFDDNFVIRHLVVYESKGKEALENPGALELLTKYKGNDQGIPYWFVFDKDGKLLADSKMRPEGASLDDVGNNSGCPASAEEVAHFVKVLKKTTSLKEEQLAVIQKRFRKNEQ